MESGAVSWLGTAAGELMTGGGELGAGRKVGTDGDVGADVGEPTAGVGKLGVGVGEGAAKRADPGVGTAEAGAGDWGRAVVVGARGSATGARVLVVRDAVSGAGDVGSGVEQGVAWCG